VKQTSTKRSYIVILKRLLLSCNNHFNKHIKSDIKRLAEAHPSQILAKHYLPYIAAFTYKG